MPHHEIHKDETSDIVFSSDSWYDTLEMKKENRPNEVQGNHFQKHLMIIIKYRRRRRTTNLHLYCWSIVSTRRNPL